MKSTDANSSTGARMIEPEYREHSAVGPEGIGCIEEEIRVAGLRVLAVCSGGGHFVQMGRIAPAFEGAEIAYASVPGGYREQVSPHRFHEIPDANRDVPLRMIWMALMVIRVVVRERPHVVITTGAAPGLVAVAAGRLMGAKTIWIDSVANVEVISLSGRVVRFFASHYLTQWPHLASDEGPEFHGSVL